MGIFLLLVSLVGASTFTLPNSTAIGYPYSVDGIVTGVSVSTICQLSAVDRFGTNTKVWGLDGNGFPIRTDANGNLHTFVKIDDSFVTGENYNFTIACGNANATNSVFIESGGTSDYSIQINNLIDYANGHPNDTILFLAGAIISVLIIGALVYAIFRKKTQWG